MMNAWVLDTNFRAISFLDVFISLIWTERYNSHGEFELYLRPEALAEKGLYANNYLQLPDSDTVMVIEDHEIETDPENGNTLTVTGKSLESILSRRIVWTQTSLSGNLQDAVEKLLNDAIINPSDSTRNISNFIFRRRYDSAITTPTVDTMFTGDNLQTAVESVLAVADLGYRVRLIKSGTDYDPLWYKSLGVGWGVDVANSKLVYSAGTRYETIYIKIRPGKTYTLSKGANTYIWAAGTCQSIPSTNNQQLTSAVNGSTTGGSVTITAGANDNYMAIQAYSTDYPATKTLKDALENLSVVANMGSSYPDYEFSFEIIYGTDRSHDQSTVPRIMFSPSFENIGGTKYVSSTKTKKTTSLVAGEGEGLERRTHEKACPEGAESGLNRRELYVDARDISSGIGNMYDDDTATQLSEGTYFDYSSGTITTSATAYKAIIFEAEPNATYVLSRSLMIESMNFQIGGFSSYPSVGSACVTNQKWDPKMEYITEEDGVTKSTTEANATFTVGSDVYYICMTLNDSSSASKTFSELVDGLSVIGTLTETGYNNKLDERGEQKLSENKATETFDGEAIPGINVEYGKDYFIGDIVTIENEYGMTADERITEFIRSEDVSGYKEVPTFTVIEEEEEET